MNDDHAREILRRAADGIEAPSGLAASAVAGARRQRARKASLAAGTALAVVAASTAGLVLLDGSGQERLASEPATSPAPERDYLRVLLPTEAPNSEVPLPVAGLDDCLALPGAGRLDSQITQSVLTVTAEGDAAQRQAVQDCLRALDRVRVLPMSGREHVPVERSSGLTPEQAARPGTDGTRECQAQFSAQDPAALEVIAGYLTDAAGFERWEWEYSGSGRISPVEPPYGDGLIVLCWLAGDVPADTSVDGAQDGFAYQLVAVQLTGQTGVRLDKRSLRPLAVLAPPPPADQHLPAGAGRQVVHPQPNGTAIGVPQDETAGEAPREVQQSPTPEAAGATAVWSINPDDPPSPTDTSFSAFVSRVECNNGETGQVQSPNIVEQDDKIVITFTVAPRPAATARCPANKAVRYDVTLSAPVGDRVLVDGSCLSGPTATTSHCDAGGQRWSPADQ